MGPRRKGVILVNNIVDPPKGWLSATSIQEGDQGNRWLSKSRAIGRWEKSFCGDHNRERAKDMQHGGFPSHPPPPPSPLPYACLEIPNRGNAYRTQAIRWTQPPGCSPHHCRPSISLSCSTSARIRVSATATCVWISSGSWPRGICRNSGRSRSPRHRHTASDEYSSSWQNEAPASSDRPDRTP